MFPCTISLSILDLLISEIIMVSWINGGVLCLRMRVCLVTAAGLARASQYMHDDRPSGHVGGSHLLLGS